MTAYFAIKLVHLFAMALWVGGPIVAGFGFERALKTPSVALDFVERLIRVTPLFVVAALTTVGSGLLLIFLSGGFSRVPGRILVGLVLTLPIFALGGAVVRPALNGIVAHLRGSPQSPVPLGLMRRFQFGHWSEQLLRYVVLALMVLR
jgi:hypothetical protein